jgi:hypothetical protein
VNTDTHADVLPALFVKETDRFNHAQTHFDTAIGVIGTGFRTARDAIVAITQCRNFFTAAQLTQLIETTEQIIQQTDQLLGGFVGTHLCKTDNIGKLKKKNR